MGLFFAIAVLTFGLFSLDLYAVNEIKEVAAIAKKIPDASAHLNNSGSFIVLGNAPISSARIIFLPEIHDDPESLLVQLLFIAQEKKRTKSFIVLDESLASMQKSTWDFFSQKSLEIIAAKEQREAQESYKPNRFEMALQKLANRFKETPGRLTFLQQQGIWAIADFSHTATPFFGWDTKSKSSIPDRNIQMVKSLKEALLRYDRILIMAGARHIPELEFFTSQKLLCPDGRFKDINEYFNAIEQKFGQNPQLNLGIGATAPIYNFLTTQKYAVVFNQAFYKELEDIATQFQNRHNRRPCTKL